MCIYISNYLYSSICTSIYIYIYMYIYVDIYMPLHLTRGNVATSEPFHHQIPQDNRQRALCKTTGYEPFARKEVTNPSHDNRLRALRKKTCYEPFARQQVTSPSRQHDTSPSRQQATSLRPHARGNVGATGDRRKRAGCTRRVSCVRVHHGVSPSANMRCSPPDPTKHERAEGISLSRCLPPPPAPTPRLALRSRSLFCSLALSYRRCSRSVSTIPPRRPPLFGG